MIYPGMARVVPRGRSTQSSRHPSGGSISRIQEIAPESRHADVLRPLVLPSNVENVIPIRSSAVRRRPVPQQLVVRAPASAPTTGPGRESAPESAASSASAAANACSAPANAPPKSERFLQSRVSELGAAAERFGTADVNIVKVFAECLVFFGLVLLKWATSLSKPQQMAAFAKLGLVSLFILMYPIYAMVAAVVLLGVYIYERFFTRAPVS